MTEDSQLLSAPWILPIVPSNTVLENHTIVTNDSKILDILPRAEAKKLYPNTAECWLDHHVLMPGLINAHTHSCMTLYRGIADDLALMEWLTKYIWPAEQATINAKTVALGNQLAFLEMLSSGTTCFSDHYFFPEVTTQAALSCGLRAIIGLHVFDIPTQWEKSEAGCLRRAQEALTQEHPPTIHHTLAPQGPYTISNEGLVSIRDLAERHQVPIHIHLHETQDEIEHSMKQHGCRPIQRLHQLGLLEQQFVAVHMVKVNDDDMHMLTNKSTSIVHCPSANLKLASGFYPLDIYLKHNMRLCIGTDGPASNNSLNMFSELKLAALLGKALTQNPTALPAHSVLEMATINAARAYGLENKIGSLESGKQADIIAINLNTPNMQPVYSPISQLVYSNSPIDVTHVWVAGQALLKNRQHTTLNKGDILEQIHALKPSLNRFAYHAQPTPIQ